ncbi:gamma-tubulin complex component 6 [Aspergillus udagawae]|uniref:Spindle pole body component n=1 Tax=Aspergillus udagawae TaxID=91492 RepID=A0A8H3NI18_9EURO|nr:gamma-tubulin complex component 6 [Aspergillus udagawae]
MTMDQGQYDADPFSSDSLWRLSNFTLEFLQPSDLFQWNENLPDLNEGFFKSPLKPRAEDADPLPQLDNIEGHNFFLFDQPAESITEAFSDTQVDDNLSHQHDDILEAESDSIWTLESLQNATIPEIALRSWERYHDRSSLEPTSAYLSESGAKGFDSALALQYSENGPKNAGRVARNDVFFHALFRLGLGWSSIFFRYNKQRKAFERVSDNIRVSGVSVTVVNGLIEEVLRCGTAMYNIRDFARRTRINPKEFSARSAFASAAAVIIYTLEKQIINYFKDISSLIQIMTLFQRCGGLVGALSNIVEAVQKAASDAQVISAVIEKAAHFSQAFGFMENLFHELVARVIAPWLHYVESWVGLRAETPASVEMAAKNEGFVAVERYEGRAGSRSAKAATLQYHYHPEQMPTFIPTEQAELIFETGRSLRLLRQYHPQHPIANDAILRKDGPNLRCAGSWSDIERIQKKAQQYEAELRSEILRYSRGQRSGQVKKNKALAEEHVQKSGSAGDDPFELFDIDDSKHMTGLFARDSSLENDELGPLFDTSTLERSRPTHPHRNDFGPEMISALYLSLAPLLSSQALLVDFSCLHLLFKEHKLRYHLTLQWRFQLLGDGFFASRLSHSLFDPEMESGERRSGVVRSGVHTGLRLGNRDTWPPASSELRLVLIGLLSDCNMDERLDNSSNAEFLRERELPGGLSFSIRDLTDDEIVKCKDPNAIEALDFLRLQYKPSAVLETIITQRSLDQYDRLFKHLLRLIRMVSVVRGLIRDSTARSSLSGDTRNLFQRFRIDCQHFVLALSDYCFHVGVGSTWHTFQDTLTRIEFCLEHGDIDGVIEAAHSVSWLRRYHEETLDQMLLALFLSRRHAEAARLLEKIFGTILTFAPLSRLDGLEGVRHDSEDTIAQLYATFRKQTSAFVGYLRGLDGVKASSKFASRSRAEPISIFERLLVRLEMKRYY